MIPPRQKWSDALEALCQLIAIFEEHLARLQEDLKEMRELVERYLAELYEKELKEVKREEATRDERGGT